MVSAFFRAAHKPSALRGLSTTLPFALLLAVLWPQTAAARAPVPQAPPPPPAVPDYNIPVPPEDTLKEVMLSLDASTVERVALDHYAIEAFSALGKRYPCVQPRIVGNTVNFTCDDKTLNAPWPPKSGLEVATLLSDSARLAEPTHLVTPEVVRLLARAFAVAVNDPYTAYLSPELVASLSAPGASNSSPGVDVWPRDPTRVREVHRGSDAVAQGILVDDRILAIDGESTDKLTYAEIVVRLSGQNETPVKITVTSTSASGAKPFTRTVTCNRSQLPEREIVARELPNGTMYVHVPVFKIGVAAQVARTLSSGRLRNVIIDLRHNGGGLVPEGIALADLFLKDGPIAAVRSGLGRTSEEYVATGDGNDVAAPLVILVDGASASASELVTMVLKARGRALVLGTRTAGKGSVQRQIHLPDGGVLKVTAAYYVGPTGARLDEGGVTPDRILGPAAGRTVLDGGDPLNDSWVLSALDALQSLQAPRNGTLTRPTPTH